MEALLRLKDSIEESEGQRSGRTESFASPRTGLDSSTAVDSSGTILLRKDTSSTTFTSSARGRSARQVVLPHARGALILASVYPPIVTRTYALVGLKPGMNVCYQIWVALVYIWILVAIHIRRVDPAPLYLEHGYPIILVAAIWGISCWVIMLTLISTPQFKAHLRNARRLDDEARARLKRHMTRVFGVVWAAIIIILLLAAMGMLRTFVKSDMSTIDTVFVITTPLCIYLYSSVLSTGAMFVGFILVELELHRHCHEFLGNEDNEGDVQLVTRLRNDHQSATRQWSIVLLLNLTLSLGGFGATIYRFVFTDAFAIAKLDNDLRPVFTDVQFAITFPFCSLIAMALYVIGIVVARTKFPRAWRTTFCQ